MLPTARNYNIYPSVLQVGKESLMTILPTERTFLLWDDKEYTITIIPRNGDELYYYEPKNFITFDVNAENGAISFGFTFEEEQEYLIQLHCGENLLSSFNVYAVKEDLYSLEALRGDLHAHSYRSDGARDPGALLGHYREQGYDFMALTDHNRYYPGEEMDEAYNGVSLGITRVKGEEVHTPGSTIHIVHVGGNRSVASEYIENIDLYENEWRENLDKVPSNIPERYKDYYAKIIWACDKIHKAGGLAIFPHPYWIPKGRVYNVCDELAGILLKSGLFDAFELMGGAETKGNNRNVSLLSSVQRDGYDIPVVGSSDVHGINKAHVFPHYFTICFAKNNSNDAICEAVKKGLCVAVEGQGNEYDRNYRAYGDLRLVSYAQFLLSYYFPERTRMCAGEGVVMRSYLMGNADKLLIESLAEFNRDFADSFFGRKEVTLPTKEMLEYEDKWRTVQLEKGPYTNGGRINGGIITRQI